MTQNNETSSSKKSAPAKQAEVAGEAGSVIQRFSHGRSQVVTVEIKRRRRTEPSPAQKEPPKPGENTQNLTNNEQEVRFQALETSRKAPTKSLADILPQKLEKETAEEKPNLSDAAEAPQAHDTFSEETNVPSAPPPFPEIKTQKEPTDSKTRAHGREASTFSETDEELPVKKKKGSPKKQESKREHKNFTRFYTTDDEAADFPPATTEKRTPTLKASSGNKQWKVPSKSLKKEISIPESLTLRELAEKLSEKVSSVIKKAMSLGLNVTANQTLDAETANVIIMEMGHTPRFEQTRHEKLETLLYGTSDIKGDDLKPRPPVITIMGHVDHGKTSLLDALRKTNVTAKEAGGITQHIGAYQVTTASGNKLTFIDTPGHAAFTEMRSRGAHVTDIVILLVAADDGVKEQTIEAIGHAKAANVPIVVAINKTDKPDANPDRVRQELMSHEILVESLGGEILDVPLSAKTGKGLDKLLEALLLQAELLELKATYTPPIKGVILEAKLDKKRGPVATVLIQQGLLEKGMTFVSGATSGRVRLILNDQLAMQKQALPSEPVEILGFEKAPEAGDDFVVTKNEAQSQEILRLRSEGHQKNTHTPASDALKQLLSGKTQSIKELPVIIKADTQGSLEAVCSSLEGITHDEVRVKILHRHVGAINESDINLAHISGALLIGFGIKSPSTLLEYAQKKGVEIQTYDIIYKLIETIKDLLSGLLTPEKKEIILGHAEVRQTFVVKKMGTIAGCYITDGVIRRGALARVLRGGTLIHETRIETVKREKNDVREVKEKYECGIFLHQYNDFEIGDIIQAFEMQNIKRSIEK